MFLRILTHRRDAEFAESGVYLDKSLFTPRPPRLSGEISEILIHHRDTEFGVIFEQDFFTRRPLRLRGETSEILIHRRGTDFTESGVFIDQQLFTRRTPRLSGADRDPEDSRSL